MNTFYTPNNFNSTNTELTNLVNEYFQYRHFKTFEDRVEITVNETLPRLYTPEELTDFCGYYAASGQWSEVTSNQPTSQGDDLIFQFYF